jgi:hypothetical protein
VQAGRARTGLVHAAACSQIGMAPARCGFEGEVSRLGWRVLPAAACTHTSLALAADDQPLLAAHHCPACDQPTCMSSSCMPSGARSWKPTEGGPFIWDRRCRMVRLQGRDRSSQQPQDSSPEAHGSAQAGSKGTQPSRNGKRRAALLNSGQLHCTAQPYNQPTAHLRPSKYSLPLASSKPALGCTVSVYPTAANKQQAGEHMPGSMRRYVQHKGRTPMQQAERPAIAGTSQNHRIAAPQCSSAAAGQQQYRPGP